MTDEEREILVVVLGQDEEGSGGDRGRGSVRFVPGDPDELVVQRNGQAGALDAAQHDPGGLQQDPAVGPDQADRADDERAALLYQHRSSNADRTIADSLDALVRAQRKQSEDDDGDDGAAGALVPVA